MKRLIETYGKPCAEELLDRTLITRRISDADMRHFLIKYGIIKQSTKMIHANVVVNTYTQVHQYQYDWEGNYVRKLNEPHYHIWARNGRGSDVFRVKFYQSDLDAIKEYMESLD